MTPERLQEIKDVFTLPYGEEYPTAEAHDYGEVIYELITALEAARLGFRSCKALAKLERENLLERNTDLIDKRNNLRAQLAEARLENTKLESKLETAKTHRKISEAEVERLEDLYNTDRQAYLDDITLLQTEVAELEDMMMLNDPSNCANAIATDDGFLITIDKKKL